jgi:penicillin-insensitive murein DD-endopeptidase
LKRARGLLAAALLTAAEAGAAESVCYGTVAKGHIEGAVALPPSGANFAAYSTIGVAAGRTYVHTAVRDVVVAAYAALEKSAPDKTFVYGETGWASGGRIRPHRTHQNGLSVDFFVPVTDAQGRSVPIPGSLSNRYGYDLEFDADGRFGAYSIDFAALGQHLFELERAARARGIGIALVIFDPPYHPRLFATEHGAQLRDSLSFMNKPAWVRHDEHYHVDFAVACRPE